MKTPWAIAAAAMVMSTSLHAQTTSGDFVITSLNTGWSADQVLIKSAGAAINPAGCSSTDGYISTSQTPGYKAHYAAALVAFSTGRTVRIVVDNAVCDVGRPRIIGVTVLAQ